MSPSDSFVSRIPLSIPNSAPLFPSAPLSNVNVQNGEKTWEFRRSFQSRGEMKWEEEKVWTLLSQSQEGGWGGLGMESINPRSHSPNDGPRGPTFPSAGNWMLRWQWKWKEVKGASHPYWKSTISSSQATPSRGHEARRDGGAGREVNLLENWLWALDFSLSLRVGLLSDVSTFHFRNVDYCRNYSNITTGSGAAGNGKALGHKLFKW